MNTRAQDFARRRALLQLQCAEQRLQFLESAQEISTDLRFVDHGIHLIRRTRVLPVLMGLLGTFGVASKAGGVVRLISRAWIFFNTFQRIKRAMK